MSNYTTARLRTGLEEGFRLPNLRLNLFPQRGHFDILENVFLHPGQK